MNFSSQKPVAPASFSLLFLAGAIFCATTFRAPAADAPIPSDFLLRSEVKVESQGVFLDDLIETKAALPHVLLSPAPALGKTITATKAQVMDWITKAAPDLNDLPIAGAAAVKISRKSRLMEEAELKEALRDLLQRDQVRERGELELRMARAWNPLTVPDEPLTIKIVDLPVQGVTPHFIARVEIRTATESVGTWSVALQARIMKEVWVAKTPITRRQLLRDCEISLEKKDVLLVREPLAQVDPSDATLEVSESVSAGAPLLARAVRARAVVHRGKVVDALVQDGGLTISAKVEVLEEGVPGQYIRVRNLKSKKEFRGKVQNEQTVLVSL